MVEWLNHLICTLPRGPSLATCVFMSELKAPGIDWVIVHAPVGGGHKAAALALAEAARGRGESAIVMNVFDYAPRWAQEAYLAAHLMGQNAMPELYGRLYESANRRDERLDPLRHEIDALLFGGLVKAVRAMAPAAILATHHLPLVVLGGARARGRSPQRPPLVGVVTDYTTHACWVEAEVDLWAVPCVEAARDAARHGAPPSRLRVTGIPVRSAFERIAPLTPMSPDAPLRVLVTSGGFGAKAMTRIVRSFADVPNVELTVVTGASPKLTKEVERVVRTSELRARVIGFERDMPSRMAEAHVVVGKAGGLTVTEAMTAARPMVIASAVPGNEAVNEARVVRAGAGVSVAPERVGAAIQALRGTSLVEMSHRARALVPTAAASQVLATTKALFAPARAA